MGDGSEGGVQEASSSGGDSTRGSWRGQQTARRSASVARRSTRVGFARRQTSARPVPIVWSEPTSGGTETLGKCSRIKACHKLQFLSGTSSSKMADRVWRTSPRESYQRQVLTTTCV
ncbi:hypothetical protein J437_LFUL018966 [Ladona fulva]|uniref:Uncharacterized protein n=1 Tax=Ladona fulva TaxID=123851 RepID=A0A8K0KQ84_LADFU|nr:hypothetical protein J437_LFUL018966 [Ladona fulva]